jgi:hypothetical protein
MVCAVTAVSLAVTARRLQVADKVMSHKLCVRVPNRRPFVLHVAVIGFIFLLICPSL